MTQRYVLRIPFDLTDPALLEERERFSLEANLLHYLKSRGSPMPDDAVMHGVEVMPRCPCCDLSEQRCACLFEDRTDGSFCLDHQRDVPA